MKKLCLTLVALVFSACVFAQPKIQFDQTTYDFGQIKEEDGKVTARFSFTNIGTEDLVLKSVRPGCGCTAANYTKTPVAPGQTGFIDATYNPAGRPGGFTKNIKVTTNEPEMDVEKPAPHMLFIKGAVTPKPKTPFERDGYTQGSGMARFKTTSTKASLLNSKSQLDTFMVKNFWTKDVTFTYDNNNSAVSEVSRSFGSSLKAGEEGFIVLKYDASKRQDFGSMKDVIKYTTNDSIQSEKELYYDVVITEDFSKMSAGQLKKAPVAKFNNTFIDFGKVKMGTTVNSEIIVTNEGKNPLIIRKVESHSGDIVVTCEKTTLKKGESATIKITYASKRKKGKQTSTITVITNDPNNSNVIVNTKAENLQ